MPFQKQRWLDSGNQAYPNNIAWVPGSTGVKLLTTSWQPILFNETSSAMIIIESGNWSVCNTTNTNKTFSLAILDAGDFTCANRNNPSPVINITLSDLTPRLVYNQTPLKISEEDGLTAAGETYEGSRQLVLEPGQLLVAKASANTAVNIIVGYLQSQ